MAPLQGDAVAFPPAPWHLTGQMLALMWSVPGAVVIRRLPRGLTPLLRKGRATVVTAWVDYAPGSVLTYRELLCAVPVLHGGRPGVCVTDIWVDSPASRAGGRALWAIPKELATFPTFDGHLFEATAATQPIASASWTPGRRLPGRWPSRFSVIQDRGGHLAVSRVRATTGVRTGRASMHTDPGGPLAYLARSTPGRALELTDVDLHFGG